MLFVLDIVCGCLGLLVLLLFLLFVVVVDVCMC